MHMSLLKSAIAVALLAAPVAAGAATTITVTGASSGVCTSAADGFCYMDQSFGDTVFVDASYQRLNALGQVIGLAHRTINFGDLGNSIGAGTGQIAEAYGRITLAARPNYQISLLDFDFARYFNFGPTIPISVRDLAGHSIVSGTYATAIGSTHANFAVDSPFVNGVVIEWGAGANVVGLDNLRYETRSLVAAVPEPGIWAMLIAGFGFVGGAMRRRALPLRAPSPA